ncbi:MAG: hypothetical protein K2Y37_09090 [Pirellulales bacterium]|nr:hypothetical protein [Pirellulales bacterium]
MSIHWASAMVVAVFSCTALVGCGGQAGTPQAGTSADATIPDPHDVPITEADVQMPTNFADAIPRIWAYRDTIRAEAQGTTPGKAHRALDELDIVLGKLPAIARDSGVPKEHWEAINTTARELRDLFNQVHAAIDDGRTPDYAAVAEPIEQAIDRLASFAPQAAQ